MHGQHCPILGEIRYHLPRRLMLLANVPVEAIFSGGFEASGIPVRHYGISGPPRRLEKVESVKHLQASSLEMA